MTSGQLILAAREATKSLEQVRTLRETRNLTFSLAQRRQFFDEAIRSLRTSLELLEELRQETVPAELDAVRERSSTVRRRLAETRQQTATPDAAASFAFGPLIEDVRNVTKACEASAHRAWFDLAKHAPTPQQGELLKILNRSQEFRAHAEVLLPVHSRLLQLAQATQPTVAHVRLFREQLAKWSETWSPIEKQMPGEIAGFLADAMGDGAQLSTLTAPVASWITAHSVEHLFRIRVA